MAAPVECQICMEDRIESQICMVDRSPICSDCAATEIAPFFEAAMKNEIYYPPRWGTHEILFEDFQDLLSPETCEGWFAKLAEYSTPAARRVYCGRRKQGSSASDNEICNFFLGVNRKSGYPADDVEPYFDDAVRGSQWQRCANLECAVVVQLRDGCNAIDCVFCRTGFCFICGEEADHDSNHWTRSAGSQCPRWNQPDTSNAMYDTEPDIGHNNLPDNVPDAPDNLPEANNAALDEIADNETENSSMDATFLNTLAGRFSTELEMMYGDLANAPHALVVFHAFLYSLWHNAYVAPTLIAHPNRIGVITLIDFRRHHLRLESGFVEAYIVALDLTRPESALHVRGDEKYALLEVFDRYLTIHADRIFIVMEASEEDLVAG